jgi:hypothetical protein
MPTISGTVSGPTSPTASPRSRMRVLCQRFFDWYNTEHRHSGIGFMIPETVHYGRAAEAHKQRAAALDAAFDRHPKRFKGAPPQPPALPTAAWINPPKKEPSGKTSDRDCTVISFRSLSSFLLTRAGVECGSSLTEEHVRQTWLDSRLVRDDSQ